MLISYKTVVLAPWSGYLYSRKTEEQNSDFTTNFTQSRVIQVWANNLFHTTLQIRSLGWYLIQLTVVWNTLPRENGNKRRIDWKTYTTKFKFEKFNLSIKIYILIIDILLIWQATRSWKWSFKTTIKRRMDTIPFGSTNTAPSKPLVPIDYSWSIYSSPSLEIH